MDSDLPNLSDSGTYVQSRGAQKEISDPNWEKINAAHRKWIADGNHLNYKCPIEGGSIRGWTSI